MKPSLKPDERLERLERMASNCSRCEDPNVCQSCPAQKALREYKASCSVKPEEREWQQTDTELNFWLGNHSPTLWVYAPPWGGYGLHRYSYVVYPRTNDE